MSTKPKPIPDEYHSITPYLSIKGAAAAIAFYQRAFGAVETVRMEGPGGRVGHAELRFGDSMVMLADECPEGPGKSPATLGGTSFGVLLYVEDCDAITAQAEAAGAKILRPLANQFYGDRSATMLDPFGHIWTVATHVEDVSPEEMKERMAKLFSRPESA
jgi:PhnB protein